MTKEAIGLRHRRRWWKLNVTVQSPLSCLVSGSMSGSQLLNEPAR